MALKSKTIREVHFIGEVVGCLGLFVKAGKHEKMFTCFFCYLPTKQKTPKKSQKQQKKKHKEKLGKVKKILSLSLSLSLYYRNDPINGFGCLRTLLF